MKLYADLHLHGRFSGATSKNLTFANLEKYARIKGISLLGTGDFQHPEWNKEIKKELTEDGSGILRTKSGFTFILQTELSFIYSQNGKGRRIHNLVLSPSLEIADQITEELSKLGRIDYDGRPIFGISCIEFMEKMMSISKDIEVIPAHCLLPYEHIHCENKIKAIKEISKGDKVLTHNGRFMKVSKVHKRLYKGNLYHVIPRYFSLGLKTTDEHPFYAIKTEKNCSWTKGICKPTEPHTNYCYSKAYLNYKPTWISAKHLSKGDVILYPRLKKVKDRRYLTIAGKKVKITMEFCRLLGYYVAVGYYIAEGCTNRTNNRNGFREGFGFTFNSNEKKFIKEVKYLVKKYFGLESKKGKREEEIRGEEEIIYYSKALMHFFRSKFYLPGEKRAQNKILPEWMLFLPPEKQIELFKGWWFGSKGYTLSRHLLNQIKTILLRLGIIPSITVNTSENHKKKENHKFGSRIISANHDAYLIHNLTFIYDCFNLSSDRHFRKFTKRPKFNYGWMDDNWVYLPIRKIKVDKYYGEVYNLEVETDNSYCSEFACVHNCWTPWFSLFGSKSGFDSVKECFGEYTKHIHALETGLSSDPAMNWRLSQLDPYTLVSNSDAHSYWPWRLGRECNVFQMKELTYKNVLSAIREKKGFLETIEVDPNYGKYHMDGHRGCSVFMKPKESLKNKNLCPKCKKKMTLGVLHRVEELADRPEGFKPKGALPFRSVIPLHEIIAAILGSSVASKRVWVEYNKILGKRNEMHVLLDAEEKEILQLTSKPISDAIMKNRRGEIRIVPGYDGQYGVPEIDSSLESSSLESSSSKEIQRGLADF